MSKVKLDNKTFRCKCADECIASGEMTVEEFTDVSY